MTATVKNSKNRPIYVILEYGVAEGTENPTGHVTLPKFYESDKHMSQVAGVIRHWRKEDFRIVSLPLQYADRWLRENYQDVIVLSASVRGFISYGDLRKYKDEIYMVCSAGNDGEKGEAPIAEKDYFTVVGAVDDRYKPYHKSGWGKGLVDFAGVLSRQEKIEYVYKGETKSEFLKGTSFAAPQHGAEIANLMTRYYDLTGRKMPISDVLAVRDANTRDIHEPGKDLKTGHGVYIYNKKQVDDLIEEGRDILMKAKDFIQKAREIVNQPTIYVMGGIGQKLTNSSVNFFANNYPYNTPRVSMYRMNLGKYAFDCVGLIKAILWDWKPGNYKYAINGIPDINANQMIDRCKPVPLDNMPVGAVVWQTDHIGIYIGDGKVIEATPAFENRVQVTNFKGRGWTKAGKLPWIDYTEPVKPEKEEVVQKPKEQVVAPWAEEAWKWGVDNKITDGLRPEDTTTRQELVTMLHRFHEKFIAKSE